MTAAIYRSAWSPPIRAVHQLRGTDARRAPQRPALGVTVTPELERKIWRAYRDAHEARAAAADSELHPLLAPFIRKRMPEGRPAETSAALKGLAYDVRNDPEVRAMYFASFVGDLVPEASTDDIMVAMNNLARAMARNDPDVLALMGRRLPNGGEGERGQEFIDRDWGQAAAKNLFRSPPCGRGVWSTRRYGGCGAEAAA
jgi:hypothetical protein